MAAKRLRTTDYHRARLGGSLVQIGEEVEDTLGLPQLPEVTENDLGEEGAKETLGMAEVLRCERDFALVYPRKNRARWPVTSSRQEIVRVRLLRFREGLSSI